MNTGGPRDPTAFMFLMPGVQSVGRWGNVMGGQDFANDTYIEGVPITNAVVQGEGRNLSYGISVEAVEQFQVETSGTAVMYNGQGASNYVIKSGTNALRGSVFEFFRHKALDSKAFFAAFKPDDNQHESGGTAGGPIRRNRVFFFVAYDGYRDRRQTESRLVSIPTVAMRSGDFSALPVQIFDPATTRPNPNGTGFVRDPFPGNIIPASRLSPISRNLQSFLPEPTSAGLQNNYLGGSLPIGFNNDNVTSKVDVNVSDAHRLSVLFAHGSRRQHTSYRGGTNAQTALPLPYTETRLVEETPATAQVKHTAVISPRWLNQLSAGFARLGVPIANATIDGGYPTQAGLRGLPPGEADSAFPEIAFLGPNPPTQWRGTDARAFTEYLNNYTIQNNLQATLGRHAITFGFQGQRLEAEERERTYGSLATFGFSNVQTAGFGATGTLNAATGNAYASFLLGESERDDRHRGLAGRHHGALHQLRLLGAGRLQGDAESVAQSRPALRHHEAVHRALRPVVVPESRSAESGGGRLPWRAAVCRGRPEQLRMPDADQDLLWQRRSASGAGVQPERPHRAARRLRDSVLAARRRRWTRRRPQRHRHARLLSQRVVPEPRRVHPVLQLEQRRAVRIARPPFFDPTLNTGFVTGRGNGGGVTYGDPEIGGRPPRYQNWNAGLQYALTSTLTVGASYAGSRGDFLDGSGRGFWSNQLDPRYLVLGNLLTQTANAANIAAARAIVPDIALPYANFSGTIGQMLRPFPQYSGVTDVYDNVNRSRYDSLQLTLDQRRAKGLTLNVNYTFSRTRDDLSARTGYNFEQDWATGVNDQPHVFNAIAVYDVPFGREGQPGGGHAGHARDHRRLAGLEHHAVPIGPADRLDPRRLQSPERGDLLRRFQPGVLGPGENQRRLGRWRRAGREPAVVHRSQRLRVGAGVHLREHAAHAGVRSAQPELLQPGSRDPARLPGRRRQQGPARRRGLQPVQHRRLWRHQQQHHERQLRAGELADQCAARDSAQGARGILMKARVLLPGLVLALAVVVGRRATAAAANAAAATGGDAAAG